MIINIKDKEILEHGFTEEVLNSFVDIGYYLYKHQVLKKIHTLANGNIDSIIEDRLKTREKELEEKIYEDVNLLKHENLELVKRMKDNESTLENKYILDIEKKNLTIQHLSSLLESSKDTNITLEKKLNDILQNIYNDSVKQLKDTIKQKEVEISCLRGNNTVKGQIGEKMIIDSLRNIFNDVEVSHTGTKAHVCDVHMTFNNNKKIVFESKFKGSIEKRDVDKFYKDVEGLPKDVIGGVFVSLLSRNIPNKGCINFEITAETKRPIMYVAYNDDNEFNLHFPHHIMMFTKLCDVYIEDVDGKVGVNDIIDEIKFLYNMLGKNKRRLDDFKTKFLKFYGDIDDDNCILFKRIENVIKNIPNQKVSQKKMFICSQCTFTCATKKTLDGHVTNIHR